MIICPLENQIIFGDCQVSSCMHNAVGKCSYLKSRTKPISDLSEEELRLVTGIRHTVVVGMFLEESSGKDILSLKTSDFSSRGEFEMWALRKKVPTKLIDFDGIVEKIKTNL